MEKTEWDKSLAQLNNYIQVCQMAEKLRPPFQESVMRMLRALEIHFIQTHDVAKNGMRPLELWDENQHEAADAILSETDETIEARLSALKEDPSG